MEIVVHVLTEVKIPTNRCNVNEIFEAVSKAWDAYAEKPALTVVEAYEKQVVTMPRRRFGSLARYG